MCVAYLTIIGSDNGLSPSRRQAIIWTNVRILLIRPLGANFSEILIEIYTFSFKKMHLKMSSAKRRPFCLGLNLLTYAVFASFRTVLGPTWWRQLVLPWAFANENINDKIRVANIIMVLSLFFATELWLLYINLHYYNHYFVSY